MNVTHQRSIGMKEAGINVLSGLQGELIHSLLTVPTRELIACAYALG